MTATQTQPSQQRPLSTDEAIEIDLLVILVALRSRRATRRNHR